MGMKYTYACPKCGKAVALSDKHIGSTITHKVCGTEFVVPDLSKGRMDDGRHELKHYVLSLLLIVGCFFGVGFLTHAMDQQGQWAVIFTSRHQREMQQWKEKEESKNADRVATLLKYFKDKEVPLEPKAAPRGMIECSHCDSCGARWSKCGKCYGAGQLECKDISANTRHMIAGFFLMSSPWESGHKCVKGMRHECRVFRDGRIEVSNRQDGSCRNCDDGQVECDACFGSKQYLERCYACEGKGYYDKKKAAELDRAKPW